MNAKGFLGPVGKSAVEQAAAAAEKRTEAEIVCAVATESGRYDRAESLVGLFGALLGLGVAALAQAEPSGSWAVERGVALGWQCFAVVAGFVAGSLAAGAFHPLRAAFTGKREMEEECAQAASHVFAREGLTATSSRGGLLIYVSIYERRVVVLADRAVIEAAGEGFLLDLRDRAVKNLRAGRRPETFLETIQAAADRLASSLPAKPDDRDDLSNRVVIIHPRP